MFKSRFTDIEPIKVLVSGLPVYRAAKALGSAASFCVLSPTQIYIESNLINRNSKDDDATVEDVFECWIFDLMSRMTIMDASPYTIAGVRVPEHLLDGVYDGNINNCYFSDRVNTPYIAFDLGAKLQISSIMIQGQPNSAIQVNFRNFQVRAGNAEVTNGDFNSYSLLASFGITNVLGQVYTVNLSPPVAARYISLQSVQPNPSDPRFQVCHLIIT